MKTSEPSELLADFEASRIDPQSFPHRAHVEVSYELLERHPFPEALLHFARGLRRMAAKAGKPEIYHETITAAFLSLTAERRLSGRYADWEDFAARNPDLMRKELLGNFYEPARLQSATARQTFVLPRARRTSWPLHFGAKRPQGELLTVKLRYKEPERGNEQVDRAAFRGQRDAVRERRARPEVRCSRGRVWTDFA